MPSKPSSQLATAAPMMPITHHKAHLAFHELLGEPASDSANDDGGDPTDLLFFHCRFLLGRPSLQTILLIRILFGTSSKTSLRHKRGRHLPRRVQDGKRGAASGHRAAEQRDELAPFQLIELFRSLPARAALQDIEWARLSQRVSER